MLDKTSLRSVYYAHFHSHLSYSISVWGSMLSMKQSQKLQKAQNVCFKIMEPNQNVTELAKSLCILKVCDLIKLDLSKMAYKLTHELLPIKLAQCMISDTGGKSLRKLHRYMTRNKTLPNLPLARLSAYQRSFLVKSISLYTNLPTELTNTKTLENFAKLF